PFEIERKNRRSRLSGAHDRVVDRFEPANVAPVQNHGCAMRGSRERDCFADTIAGAGDENDAVAEEVSGRRAGAWIHGVRIAVRGRESDLSLTPPSTRARPLSVPASGRGA